jgi:hypothetical protein
MSLSPRRNTSHAQRSGDERVEVFAARGEDRYGRILATSVAPLSLAWSLCRGAGHKVEGCDGFLAVQEDGWPGIAPITIRAVYTPGVYIRPCAGGKHASSLQTQDISKEQVGPPPGEGKTALGRR